MGDERSFGTNVNLDLGNVRVLSVCTDGDLELYKPKERKVVVAGSVHKAGYVERAEIYGGHIALVLNGFRGEIGIPEGVVFEVTALDDDEVVGVVPGPGYIRVHGVVDLRHPLGSNVVTFGRVVYVDGGPIVEEVKEIPEDPDALTQDEKLVFYQSDPELLSRFSRDLDLPIPQGGVRESPEGLRINRSIRGGLPRWLSDNLMRVDRDKLLVVSSEDVVNLEGYVPDIFDVEALPEMGLQDYALGLMQGTMPSEKRKG